MKTKIIYISGGETFEMAQIRTAFDEVRATLGLGSDTVLFGVPVDCDDALAETESNNISSIMAEPVAEPTDSVVESSEVIPTPISSEIPTDITPIIEDTPKKKGRARKEIVIEEPMNASAEEVADVDDTAKVIPILSILATKSEGATENVTETPAVDTVEEVISESVDNVVTESETVTISDIGLDTPLMAPVSDSSDDVEKITIGDMIDDAAPSAPVEKTLEQLLERMTPLREDVNSDTDMSSADETMDEIVDFTDSDTDATLAQLASEFVQNEDKIISTPKSESQGKIGKLKNILPFKKAKRDDNSLMGDLFGWAGIAANDEEFSMPGFFTPARKQGS